MIDLSGVRAGIPALARNVTDGINIELDIALEAMNTSSSRRLPRSDGASTSFEYTLLN